MKLQDWLDRDGHTQRWLAARIGVSPPTVNQWLKGKTPSRDHQEALAVLSDGLVRPLDWIDIMDIAPGDGDG